MQRLTGYARQLPAGAHAPLATVDVFLSGTVSRVPLYSDNLSPPTPLANPVVCDVNGYYQFFTPNQLVDLRFSGGGIVAPYTIADVPAGGIGDGGLLPVSSSSFPATSPQHRGRLRLLVDSTLGAPGIYVQDLAEWRPALDYAFSTYARAALPTAGGPGRLRRVNDPGGVQGLYMDNGVAWDPVLSYPFDATPRASLPTPGLPGRVRRVTDGPRGLWMDQNQQWFSLGREWVDVREFGARGDGLTDDSPAINAALAQVSSLAGGLIIVPGGHTYVVKSPLLMRDSTTVFAHGASFLLPSDFSGDALFRCIDRDDNVLLGQNRYRVIGGRYIVDHTIPAFAVFDFTGCGLSGGLTSVHTIFNSHIANRSSVRLADRNRAGTSLKQCRGVVMTDVQSLGAWIFLDVEQQGGQCFSHVVQGFLATALRRGFVFAGTFTPQPAWLTLIAGRVVGDTISDGSAFALSPLFPSGLDLLHVEGFNFGDGNGGLISPVQFGETIALAASGTSILSPVSPGGSTPIVFTGSAYVRVPAGTVLPANNVSFTYTLPSAPPGATFLVAFVSGLPAARVTPQAQLSGTALTLTLSVSGPVTLVSDLIMRIIQIAP